MIRFANRIDRNVLDYVFFKQYHQGQINDILTSTPIILDLGSNIGLTVADFKIKYPGSKVYGYEMDKGNFVLARKNCEKFNQVQLFNKAVWKNTGKIRYGNDNTPDAYSVTEHSPTGIEVECITISDILEENNLAYVDILKMDIEGAELDIIYSHDVSWLARIKSFNIEFHNQTEVEMNRHIDFFNSHGFFTQRGLHHWNSLEGRNNSFGT
ncbi:MAG: FkbM family methyltransferase [Flavobacterium sp.]|nr:MAG: FkbM family methyltransferase [Flavobacterium sp.]